MITLFWRRDKRNGQTVSQNAFSRWLARPFGYAARPGIVTGQVSD